MPTLVLDIEADGFLYEVSTIWCLVAYEVETQTYHIYHVDAEGEVCYPKKHILYKDIEEYLELLSTSFLVNHNLLGYDLPLLNKLYGFKYNLDNLDDTAVMSRLSYPDRPSHSLEYWGDKLRFPKGNHSDFSKFSNDMLQYCIQDVDITCRVYDILKEEMSGWDWSESLRLEYHLQHIQTIQEQNGVLFDVAKAEELIKKINTEIKEIDNLVIPSIPSTVVDLGPVNKPFLKSGEYSEQAKKWLAGLT